MTNVEIAWNMPTCRNRPSDGDEAAARRRRARPTGAGQDGRLLQACRPGRANRSLLSYVPAVPRDGWRTMAGHRSKQALRGRSRECEALDSVLHDARAGRSRVLVLRGEAGIGKTALLEHLHERASNCRVERVSGVESEMELPFAGLHQLCASMVDHFDHLPGPQRGALATIFGIEAGPPPDQFLLGLSVLSLLSDVAEDRPLVCIVDDAHWLDRATATTLAFAARRLLAEPVALVFAVREPASEPTLTGLPELLIHGLAKDDALALLDAATVRMLNERVRARIVAETRGNPLALLELPRALTAVELELGFGSPDPTAVAGRIEEGYRRQLVHLPVDTRRLLLTAAVEPLGDMTLLWRAAERLGIGVDAAAPAEEAGLITLHGRVRFRHPLVRSVISRTARASDVRAAHRALAEAIDAAVDPDRRAWHRAHAVTGSDEAVARELEVAADRARGRGASVAAAAFLQRAAELTADPSRRGARALSAAAAKVFSGELDSGLEMLAMAELCPLVPRQRAWALRLRASLLSLHGQVSDRARMFLVAAEMFHPDAPTARDTYCNALGTQMSIGRLGGQERLHEFATAARRAPAGPEPQRTIDLVLDALAIRFTDGYEAGLVPARRALAACAEERDHGQQFHQWVWFAPPLAPEVWDDEAWHRITANIVRLNRDAGAINVLPMALQFRAEFELHAGESAAVDALLDEIGTIVELTGRRDLHSSLEFEAWRGDDDASDVIDSVVQLMTGYGTGRTTGLGEYAKAVLHNGRGQYEDALAACRRACEFDDIGVYGRCLVEYVEAASRGGALDDAHWALQQLEPRTLASGTDWALGMLARSRALLSDDGETESLYRDAIERLGRTRMAVHLARAHLVYGEWLRREHRRVDAREQLRLAHEMLTRMGAVAFAERARRELLATGDKVRKRSDDTSDALTPQEAQIARLVVDGASNPEIGSRLFISPRTVEYHLSKVFVKLGVKSRRELRSVLRHSSPSRPTGPSSGRGLPS
jgi:DNA-binding CsgD family transcriptional regulator